MALFRRKTRRFPLCGFKLPHEHNVTLGRRSAIPIALQKSTEDALQYFSQALNYSPIPIDYTRLPMSFNHPPYPIVYCNNIATESSILPRVLYLLPTYRYTFKDSDKAKCCTLISEYDSATGTYKNSNLLCNRLDFFVRLCRSSFGGTTTNEWHLNELSQSFDVNQNTFLFNIHYVFLLGTQRNAIIFISSRFRLLFLLSNDRTWHNNPIATLSFLFLSVITNVYNIQDFDFDSTTCRQASLITINHIFWMNPGNEPQELYLLKYLKISHYT